MDTEAQAAIDEAPAWRAPIGAVLDTNVALDLFVFADPRCDGVRAALGAGRLQWVGTRAMRDELAHVLARGLGPRWSTAPDTVLSQWDAHALVLPVPPRAGLDCRDPDDQMFVDLAMALRAPLLLTRDKALLDLRRRAGAAGVLIVEPARWPGS